MKFQNKTIIQLNFNKILKGLLIFSIFLCFIAALTGQNTNSGIQNIIEKIKTLENQRDSKCYATANRLEDFMYGTPLTEEARNVKIDIQKEFILYIRTEGSKNANEHLKDSIYLTDVNKVVENTMKYGKDQKGSWYIELQEGPMYIEDVDFRQYSSVSYAYRSLLSVEQDLLFIPNLSFVPFAKESIEPLYKIINLVTLATLKIADNNARIENRNEITKKDITNSWVHLLQSSNQNELVQFTYPTLEKSDNQSSKLLLRNIVNQKIESYQNYNNLNASVFLRNIQVYFAKQKWPTDIELSDQLKNYLLESLIAFSKELILTSEMHATSNGEALIRLQRVQDALEQFMPFSINLFEDVCFFPNLKEESITIESYDLDAFRDSGWHWVILDYALNDLDNESHLDLDPNAAELIVEGIAQLGVLVLRLAGQSSKDKEKSLLTVEDITDAFTIVQSKISNYPREQNENNTNNTVFSTPDETDKSLGGFQNITKATGIEFTHKSSDWLSRFIRSYVVSVENQTIKLAIPPAFGGSGVAASDINNDNLIDILLLGGFGNKLYINSGDGTFFESKMSEQLNIWHEDTGSYGEPRQPIIVDFDNDGFKDIFISYVNDKHKLLRNIDGLKFEDVTDLGQFGGEGMVGGPVTAFDYDNDGLLDIFIGYFGNYIKGDLPTLSRNNQNGQANKLFKNLGGFKFSEIGFSDNLDKNSGWTQALGHTDLDQDGFQDVIVGNDFGINEYYLNKGDGTFEEVSHNLGTDKPSYTMNIGIADLNKDQHPDLYISNIVVMQKDEKYVSPNEKTTMKFDPEKMANIRTVEANDLFISQVEGGRLSKYILSDDIGRGFSSTGWSWDADFFDYDNDGDDDLYVLNGMNDFSVYSTENPYYEIDGKLTSEISYAKSERERNVFFTNDKGTLINNASELGTDIISNSRSAGFLDFDNDGDLDIIINNYHAEAVLLSNNTKNSNHWIKILLEGSSKFNINRDAVGSTITVITPDGNNQWHEIHSTDGYLSVHPKIQHIGLGHYQNADVLVRWTNGEKYLIKNLNSKHAYKILYPDKIEKLY